MPQNLENSVNTTKSNHDPRGETILAMALFDGAIVSPWLQHIARMNYVNLDQLKISTPYVYYNDSKFLMGNYNFYINNNVPVQYRYYSYRDHEGDIVHMRIPLNSHYEELKFDANGNSYSLKPNGEPVLTSDQFDIIKNQQRLQDGKIPEYKEISAERMKAVRAPNNVLLGMMGGILGALGAYQMFCSIAQNNTLFRNAYTKYVVEINNLQESELNKIYEKHPNDVKLQYSAIAGLAAAKQTKSIFYDTLQPGIAVTLIFSLILSFVVGSFALIGTAVGFIVSAMVATYNYKVLSSTIRDFDANEVNDLIDQKIQRSPKTSLKAPRSKNTILNSILNLISITTISMRIATIVQLGVALISFPVLAVFELFNSVLRFYNTHKTLGMLFNNTKQVIYSGLQVNIETVSMTSNKFSRNAFKKYLLSNLSRVEQVISEHDLKSTTSDSRFVALVRPIMSLLGIWENARFNNALNALYANNRKSHMQLELLRRECADLAISKKLENYFKKHNKTVSVAELLNTDPETYATITRAYLTEFASKEVNQVITNTGSTNALSLALIVASALLAFSPLGPYAFVAAAGVFSVIYATTKIAAYLNSYKMQQKLGALNAAEFDAAIQASKEIVTRATAVLTLNTTTPVVQNLEQNVLPEERNKGAIANQPKRSDLVFQGPSKATVASVTDSFVPATPSLKLN